MSAVKPPIDRFPVGQSPRWITVHVFVGFFSFPALILVSLLVPSDYVWVIRALLTAIVMGVLASLARQYAVRRHTMTKVETSYLRFGLFVIAGTGIPAGKWYLAIPAGIAFYVWTIVDRRKRKGSLGVGGHVDWIPHTHR